MRFTFIAAEKAEHGVILCRCCGSTRAMKLFIEVIREFMLITAGLGSANEPIPLRCELLNEGPRNLAVAAPALPHVHRMAGEFGRAVLRVFEKLEATVLATIEACTNCRPMPLNSRPVVAKYLPMAREHARIAPFDT